MRIFLLVLPLLGVYALAFSVQSAHVEPVNVDTFPNSAPFEVQHSGLPSGTGTWYYNPVGEPSWGQNSASKVMSAIAAWNGVSPNLSLMYGGPTTVSQSLCDTGGSPPDGISMIRFTNVLGQGLAGQACWWGTGECDIWIGTGFPSIDIRAIVMHELGHCVGLGHSDDNTSLMYPVLRVSHAGPERDDRDGVCAIYGCPMGSPVPTFTPTPSATATATPTLAPTRQRRYFPEVAKD